MKTKLSSADGRKTPLEIEETFSSRAVPSSAPIAKNRTRRSPKLTVELGRVIVGAIAAGNFPTVAARMAGISAGTLERWLEQGEEGQQPYADFATAFQRAEDEGEAAMVAIWKSAAPADWRAAKEYLAKRHPERWSEHAAKLAVLGPEGYSGSAFGLSINLHLGPPPGGWFPEPIDRSAEAARTIQEAEDRRARKLDIQAIEVLSDPPKDAL